MELLFACALQAVVQDARCEMVELRAIVHVFPLEDAIRRDLFAPAVAMCEVGAVAIGWLAPLGCVQGSAEAHLNSSPKMFPVSADWHESTHKYARSKGAPLIISEASKN